MLDFQMEGHVMPSLHVVIERWFLLVILSTFRFEDLFKDVLVLVCYVYLWRADVRKAFRNGSVWKSGLGSWFSYSVC